MATFHYKQQQYDCRENETVLDTLLRENVSIPHGCRQGVCQSCLLRSIDNPPPKHSQENLSTNQKQQNHFLSCLCVPEQAMQIETIDTFNFEYEFQVLAKRMLNHNTLLLRLSHGKQFIFKAGQFVNLKTPDNIIRSYSISNIPNEQDYIELQIRLLPNGRFSYWVHHDLNLGDKVPASSARGHCFYTMEQQEQGLLLIGTGTGLAPLYGILQDALAQNHRGKIHLFHGSRTVEDLYLSEKIQKLTVNHENFNYTACISGNYDDNYKDDYSQGRANDIALSTYTNLNNWRVYLCGHPEMVKQMQTQVFLKGANLEDIYADAFHLSH
ncbi:MAG: FAD-binding oxidoreductase [Methylococcales bacterium]|nr:FAD-binding oxidoreductase [Methylococcales bacterium]